MLMQRGEKTRRSQAALISALLAMLLVGCGGFTTTIKQGKDLGSSGVAYSDSIIALIDTTVDVVIDTDSDQLLISRLIPNRDAVTTLDDYNKALLAELKEFGQLRRNNLLIKAYFVNLQALADSDAPTATGAALKDLSGAINAANMGLRDSKRAVFTADQQGLFAKLGTLVVKNVQAAKIRQALEEDGKLIAEQLVWQETLVASLSKTLKDSYTRQNNRLKNDRVLVPYRDGKNLGEPWKADRKTWLKSEFQLQALDKARDAAGHMRSVWEGILNGETDAGSVAILLDDLNQLAATAAAFDKSERARSGSK